MSTKKFYRRSRKTGNTKRNLSSQVKGGRSKLERKIERIVNRIDDLEQQIKDLEKLIE